MPRAGVRLTGLARGVRRVGQGRRRPPREGGVRERVSRGVRRGQGHLQAGICGRERGREETPAQEPRVHDSIPRFGQHAGCRGHGVLPAGRRKVSKIGSLSFRILK